VIVALATWAHPLAMGHQRSERANIDRALALQAGADADPIRVIVRTRQDASERVKRVVTHHGHDILADHPTISSFAAVVHRGDIDALAADPGVEGISLDAIVSAHQTKVSSLYATEYPSAGPSGASSRVAVIDSGLEPTADLGGARLIGFYDFTRGSVSAAAFDDYGHGTHVAGLIAGNAGNSNGYYKGMVPDAKILALKVLDNNGNGYTSSVISAIDFILANQKSFAIDVINLSLGHPIYESAATDPLVLEVQKAVQAGIVVVVAAGNYGQDPTTGATGYAGITSPGNAPSALTIGCVNTQDTVGRGDDAVCPYSSRGPSWYDGHAKPDLVVPGHRLVSVAALQSTLYQLYPDLRVVGKTGDVPRYFRLSGTSMATAVATGAVAALLDAVGGNKKYFTPNLIKAILEWTAIPVAGFDTLTEGNGSLNITGAIAFAKKINASLPVGSAWLTAIVTPSTTIGGVACPWVQTIMWGNTISVGTPLDINQPAWAKTVLWGSSATWPSTVVWGNDVVWTDTSVWSSTVVWGNSLVDTGGSTVVWGNANPVTTVVWGNGKTVVWGNLASVGLSGASTFSIIQP
jgi:serine protease AprX